MREQAPKLMHTLAKMLVRPIIEKSLFGKEHVKPINLIGAQAYAFERCAILGILCSEAKFPFFVILGGAEGMEEGGLAAVGGLARDLVLPYVDDADGFNELVNNSAMAKTGFEGNPMGFFASMAKEKLPVESAHTMVSLWSSLGGYMGLEFPDVITKWLYQTYDSDEGLYSKWDEARSFGLDIAEKKPYESSDQVIDEAVTLFSEYCREFYPEKVHHFSIVD
ncbi:MAG: hypothetical protein KBD94_10645 [Pyrinomonadaceae bacterium]|nr:hypothetical protein [Pyrinomonadaceae bacterium]